MISDGRMFGWQRTRGTREQIRPVIVWDKLHGCVKHFEFVGGLHAMKPEHYSMTLAELAALYPIPAIQEE